MFHTTFVFTWTVTFVSYHICLHLNRDICSIPHLSSPEPWHMFYHICLHLEPWHLFHTTYVFTWNRNICFIPHLSLYSQSSHFSSSPNSTESEPITCQFEPNVEAVDWKILLNCWLKEIIELLNERYYWWWMTISNYFLFKFSQKVWEFCFNFKWVSVILYF